MRTVAIAGVGLIGGSFALALRKAGFSGTIVGVSSPGAIREAIEHNVIDEERTLEDAVRRADLVFLSQPIRRILDTLGKIDSCLQPEALVTDAGSTKVEIVRRAESVITRAQFLGGHPMAGKETRGPASAEADLFAGRTWVLTPARVDALDTPAAQAFVEWLRKIGAVPLILHPAEHDRMVAFTSHLPQLASTALSAAIAAANPALAAAGPGLVDATRLALSPYEIWSDILATNAAQIGAALDAYIAQISELRAVLTDPEMERHFRAAAEFAARLRGTPWSTI